MAFYHFLVLGEEKRQYYLAQMLKKEGHEVMEAMSYQPGYHDAILLPVPQTAMFFEENKEKFQKGQVVYGCKFPETAIDYAKERGIQRRWCGGEKCTGYRRGSRFRGAYPWMCKHSGE